MTAKPDVILVVDDNEGTRYALAHSLRRSGFEVWEAASGVDALRLAARNPSLITLDVRLPDILGFEVCRRLKADPATTSIPILQTSASFVQSADRTHGLQGGADGYLVQPIDPEELVATVQALLRARRAETLARELASQWQGTFDAISNGICILDADEAVERCNQAFIDLIGLDRSSVVGHSFAEVIALMGVRDGAFLESIRGDRFQSKEITLGVNSFRLTLNPIAAREGQGKKTACVFSDITAVLHAEKRLHRINEELEERVSSRTRALEEVNARLESFCYSVSHDLRAPLRTLHGFSELLLSDHSGQLDPEGKLFVERIRAAAGTMDVLIHDLLLFSTVCKEALELEAVSLAELSAELLSSHREEFAARKTVLLVEIDPALAVRAHRATLRQVLWNLLTNAAKFVAAGTTPRIILSAQHQQDRDRVRLTITDNGIGIAPEHQERIFEIFERIYPEKFAGNGMGLAIVRRAMERMEGALGVASLPGQGSSFWIELPAANAKTASPGSPDVNV